MAGADQRRLHPRDGVREACARFGDEAVVAWCADLLSGRSDVDDRGDPPIHWLGGIGGWQPYWARVWGARGFLYVWDDSAAPDVATALSDRAWRVREMAAKVVRLREVGEAAEALSPLLDDPAERVRVAALRAIAVVGEGEHLPLAQAAQGDESPRVRAAAAQALADLERRLDRRA